MQTMSDPASPPAVPRRLLAAGAAAVAVPVLTVGGLLAALSEETGPRVAGVLLALAALWTVGAGLAALRPTVAPRGPLRAAVAALLLAGVVAVALVAARGSVFLLDLVIVGGVPAGAALVLGVLTRSAEPPRAA